jgi:triose-phosphate isomerase
MIRRHISHLYGKKAAESVRIVYGGSITLMNAVDYLAIDELDGLLVGTASLDVHQFKEIISKAHKG